MKKYHLTYEHCGTPRHLEFDNLFEFSQDLERVQRDQNIPDTSIDFFTTIKEN